MVGELDGEAPCNAVVRKGRVGSEAAEGAGQGLPLWLCFYQAWGKSQSRGKGQQKCQNQ